MRITYALVLSLLLVGCGGDGDEGTDPGPDPQPNTVRATITNVFSPPSLEVAVGTTVTWVFETTHNVTFEAVAGAPSSIGTTSTGSVPRVFGTAGPFPYVCTIHPGISRVGGVE